MLRIFLSIVVGFTLLFVLAMTLVYVYEDEVKEMIIAELNKHLKSEIIVKPQDIDLTIVQSFPECALRFRRVTALEAIDTKDKDTLFYADNIMLSFSLRDLFYKRYNINEILIQRATFNPSVDKLGKPNYIIWKTDTASKGENVNFALEMIRLDDVELQYKNVSTRVKCNGHIPSLEFKGTFGDHEYSMEAKGNAFIELLQVKKVKYIASKNLKFDVDVDVSGNTYTFRQADLKLNQMSFNAAGSMIFADSLELLHLDYKGKNLEIAPVLSLLPEQYQHNIADYSSDGLFYAEGLLNYKSGEPITVSSKFGIKQATITYKPQSATLTDVNLAGELEVADGISKLLLKGISARLGSNTFRGDCELSNFNDPYLTLDADIKTDLAEMIRFYPIDTIQALSGNLDLNTHIAGLIRNLKHPSGADDIKASGSATWHDLKLRFKNSTKELNIPGGDLRLEGRDVQLTDVKIMHGNSDLTLTGSIPAFLTYVFDSKAPLEIDADLESSRLEMEDFLVSGGKEGTSEVSIPANLHFNLDASIGKFSFAKFSASDIKGNIYIRDQKLYVKNLVLNTLDGKATLNAIADASGEQIAISAESDLTGINIQKLFYQFNNFGQTTLQDKHLKGFATASIDFSGKWSRQLTADLSSINATSSLLIERGELNEFKPLESLAKYIEVKELQHIRFSTMQSAVEIKDKTITIPKTSIKSSAINIELWGKHTFENMIDYHIQLLLSELLAKKPRAGKGLDEELELVENDPENRRSVFIMMTGPIDNPVIKYDRRGAREKIKQDIKQEKQNLKQLLKEEFGLFKKDSLQKKESHLSDQNFKLETGSDNKKPKPTLQPKKKDEEDEDF
ncbi:MAG: hypothetical protein JST26_10325 [Bacteroidetes bacterium]|nr:hypothetical protein [Bacteroidota bacterium]